MKLKLDLLLVENTAELGSPPVLESKSGTKDATSEADEGIEEEEGSEKCDGDMDTCGVLSSIVAVESWR